MHARNILRLSCVVVLMGAIAFTGCSREAKKARALERADRFFKQQEYAKAEIEYFNALRQGEEDPNIIRQLGLLYTEQGRLSRAMRAFGRLTQLRTNDWDAHIKLGNVLFNARAFNRARWEALLVLTNQPANIDAITLLGDTAFKPPEIAETRRILQQYVAKSGPTAGTHLASANLFITEGNLPAGEDQLKQATTQDSNYPALNMGWARLRLAETNLIEAEALLKRAAESASPRSLSQMQWIDFRLARGDVAGAKQTLNEVTQKAADFVPAWNRLAEIALMEQRFDESDKITTKVLGIDPGNYEAMLVRTRLASAQGKFDDALKEAVRLDAAYTNLPPVKYELALAQLRVGQTNKAMATVDEALRADPNFAQATLLKAELSLSTGNSGDAVRLLTQLLKSRPELSQAAMLLARAYEAEGNLDQALTIYRQMAQRYPKNPVPFGAAGIILRKRGDIAGARAAFEQSHTLAPAYMLPVEHLVDFDILATNFPSALARCAQLSAAATNSASGFLLESKVYFTKGDAKGAEAALLKGLEREPDSLAIYTLLGNLYIRTREWEKGLEKLDSIIARMPKNSKVFAAWMQKGLIYEQLGQTEKAKEAYRKAIESNESFAPALNNLAVLLAEDSKQLDQAFALATRARQAAPTDPSIADTLGWILYKRRNFSGALPLLRESAEKLQMAEVLYHVGLAEYAMGDESRARLAFNQAAKGKLPEPLEQDLKARQEIINIDPASAKEPQIRQLEAAVKRDTGDFLAQMKLGAIYLAQNSADRARAAFEAASRANPQSAPPLAALAALYVDHFRDNQRALQLARDARKFAPNDAPLALSLGAVALRAHDYPFALILLDEGRRGTTRSDTLYLLGLAQYGNGRMTEAEASLKSFMAQSSDAQLKQAAQEALWLMNSAATDPDKRLSLAERRLKSDSNDLLALVALAETQEQRKDFKGAVKTYEEAIALSPGFWPARKQAALLYEGHLGDDKNAQAHATKVRQAMPDDVQMIQLLGKAALKQGQLNEALRLLQQASRSMPTNGETFYYLGLVNYRLKRTNDCKAAMAKALQLPLSSGLGQEARRIAAELK